MINIPPDDIVLSSFKRITVWNLTNSNQNSILDKALTTNILNDYFRSKYENNYFYFNRDEHLIVKISQNVI